jgi:hypothetical protein
MGARDVRLASSSGQLLAPFERGTRWDRCYERVLVVHRQWEAWQE